MLTCTFIISSVLCMYVDFDVNRNNHSLIGGYQHHNDRTKCCTTYRYENQNRKHENIIEVLGLPFIRLCLYNFNKCNMSCERLFMHHSLKTSASKIYTDILVYFIQL